MVARQLSQVTVFHLLGIDLERSLWLLDRKILKWKWQSAINCKDLPCCRNIIKRWLRRISVDDSTLRWYRSHVSVAGRSMLYHDVAFYVSNWFLNVFHSERYLLDICNRCDMPTGDAYSSGHLVPSHLGLAYALLFRSVISKFVMFFRFWISSIPRCFYFASLCDLLTFIF